MRPVFQWNLGRRSLELGRRTLIMGIVNVTPDSFSDGGQFLDSGKAVAQAERLLDEGADIIDVGGESTRPGARVQAASGRKSEGASDQKPPVSADEELRRVIPVIANLKENHPDCVISVDTYKASVARAALEAGAEIVNDVSGFRWDPQMPRTVADLGCGAVLMHMRGRPETWRNLPPAQNIVELVKRELKQWAEDAMSAGIPRETLVLDPGLGFGKNFDENYPLIGRFKELHDLGFPLLAGTSRKSFIGLTVGRGQKVPTGERLYGTLASETALILRGAHIIRTHDVEALAGAARVADAILHC